MALPILQQHQHQRLTHCTCRRIQGSPALPLQPLMRRNLLHGKRIRGLLHEDLLQEVLRRVRRCPPSHHPWRMPSYWRAGQGRFAGGSCGGRRPSASSAAIPLPAGRLRGGWAEGWAGSSPRTCPPSAPPRRGSPPSTPERHPKK
jgi:hypothetical protein